MVVDYLSSSFVRFQKICKKSGSLAAEVNGHHYHHILLRLDDSFVQVGILDCKIWLWFCLQKQWCCFVENQMCVHTCNIYTSVVSSKGRNSINLSFLLSCKIITPTSNIPDPVTTLDRILLLRPLIFKIMSWNPVVFMFVVFLRCYSLPIIGTNFCVTEIMSTASFMTQNIFSKSTIAPISRLYVVNTDLFDAISDAWPYIWSG